MRPLLGAALLVAASGVTPTSAQEGGALRLRLADSLPAGHFLTNYATRYFMEEVTKRSNGAVTFEHYPSEQLGKAKDIIALTQNGVVDIGYAPVAAVADKLPLSAVAELPGTFTTSCHGTLAFWKLAREGILAKQEFAPQRLRVIFAYVNPPFQLFGARPALSTVQAFHGAKLRAVGGAQTLTVRAFGAVPVSLTTSEVHEGLTRGTIDGILFPVPNIYSYDLQRELKTYTDRKNFGSSVGAYMISERKWQSLPQPVRDVMTAVGDEATRRACDLADRDVEAAYKRFQELGLKKLETTPEQDAALEAALKTVTADWVQRLDGQRKPAREVLARFEEALAEVR
ncbi:TRAP transporter substrate-binding protein DctP [Azospirillum sp. RWY-5-1]|uniref:TRAP transporter substrate-binding protein DctP n=1 Tax=Azospirillum oleiclasticum TaxID=2735135 RepID=A0ABX2TG63_9PROT|nr:TRAP transporter substrate-binding protein DctP [Azospirillum oleiclasticum]NYZ14400.1 TRAP transporter substrate-binding protein DctP [Azospirillum oleiclasticum]NYZ23248.1 TRAP transporter substrate-binding protein DctP [Azospirillum oleiclasticum]